jgi:hypothetical protein
LIVTEGSVTEPQYFSGLKRERRLSGVRIVYENPVTDPVALVEQAVRKRDQLEDDVYDQVWCVFDIEDPPRGRIHDALNLASREELEVAQSNPFFELWLLLHSEDHRSHISTANVTTRVSKFSGYRDKHVNFEAFDSTLEQAVARAMSLEEMHAKSGRTCPDDNPSSSVAHLVSALLAFGSAP